MPKKAGRPLLLTMGVESWDLFQLSKEGWMTLPPTVEEWRMRKKWWKRSWWCCFTLFIWMLLRFTWSVVSEQLSVLWMSNLSMMDIPSHMRHLKHIFHLKLHLKDQRWQTRTFFGHENLKYVLLKNRTYDFLLSISKKLFFSIKFKNKFIMQ